MNMNAICSNYWKEKELIIEFFTLLSSAKPWYHLWRPGKYSEKDHDKIAEKYNLHPKEYKPYPNNEKYLGDYPALPAIGSAVKDPYYPYDIPTHRKNYQETVSS